MGCAAVASSDQIVQIRELNLGPSTILQYYNKRKKAAQIRANKLVLLTFCRRGRNLDSAIQLQTK